MHQVQIGHGTRFVHQVAADVSYWNREVTLTWIPSCEIDQYGFLMQTVVKVIEIYITATSWHENPFLITGLLWDEGIGLMAVSD